MFRYLNRDGYLEILLRMLLQKSFHPIVKPGVESRNRRAMCILSFPFPQMQKCCKIISKIMNLIKFYIQTNLIYYVCFNNSKHFIKSQETLWNFLLFKMYSSFNIYVGRLFCLLSLKYSSIVCWSNITLLRICMRVFIQKQTYDAGYPIYPHFGREGGRNFE